MSMLPDSRLRSCAALLAAFAILSAAAAAAGELQVRPAGLSAADGRLQWLDPAAPATPSAPAGEKILSTLFSDDFESGFPGTEWTRTYDGTGPYWDEWTCWANSGSYSIGCAAGGTGAISCGETYPNGVTTWMRYGPVDLSDPDYVAAEWQCQLNLNCEAMVGDVVKDFFYIGASLDGADFYGQVYAGSGTQPVSLDLTQIATLGNLLGQSAVYLAFAFVSDESAGLANGAQVDDAALIVDVVVPNQAPEVTLLSPNGGENWTGNETRAITWAATDPDAGPDPLSISLDYSDDDGSTWTEIATELANTGTYDWRVADVTTDQARVRVRADDGEDVASDASDTVFRIDEEIVRNFLALGDESGPSGTTVIVGLSLENLDPVKGIQADIVFDGTKAFYSGITPGIRADGMTVAGEQVDANRARVLVYFDTDNSIAPGSGEMALIGFTLQGAGGGSTDLVLENMYLSDPDGASLKTEGTDGRLQVEAPQEVPELQISALKNPGRPRTLQILVRVANGSGSPPTVSAAGSTVTMTSLGEAVYVGTYSAPASLAAVTISASDSNIQGIGTAQVTVAWTEGGAR